MGYRKIFLGSFQSNPSYGLIMRIFDKSNGKIDTKIQLDLALVGTSYTVFELWNHYRFHHLFSENAHIKNRFVDDMFNNGVFDLRKANLAAILEAFFSLHGRMFGISLYTDLSASVSICPVLPHVKLIDPDELNWDGNFDIDDIHIGKMALEYGDLTNNYPDELEKIAVSNAVWDHFNQRTSMVHYFNIMDDDFGGCGVQYYFKCAGLNHSLYNQNKFNIPPEVLVHHAN
jgi:hypothetical protein